MQKSVGVVVPDLCLLESDEFLIYLDGCEFVKDVLVFGNNPAFIEFAKYKKTDISGIHSTTDIKKLVQRCNYDFIFFVKDKTWLNPGQFVFERMLSVATDTGAGMVYGDFFEEHEGIVKSHPLIDYQQGSLRDDFHFGSLVLFNGKAFRQAADNISEGLEHAAFYNLRLNVSVDYPIIHIPEFLYTIKELDSRKSGQQIFDYVDPKNRSVQMEMEQVVTEHLKKIGAYLMPEFRPVQFNEEGFPVTASVIIPVKNRMKTIEDAVESVLNQKTNFKFNLIVVDNHSTDGTFGILEFIAGMDERLIHHIPERKDLGIGGCWNEALHHPECGLFAVQLDSDDIYKDENTLQKIVDAFYEQQCAMVIGSYQLVNFKLEEIPPGMIDHKEWTPENGRNNALRINGLGAPRAFYTPILRELKIPNVSYGEDYAIALAISRHYQIGRIYESLYLCRRWDDNTDAALDTEKMNRHNWYKDRIRSIELNARKQINAGKK